MITRIEALNYRCLRRVSQGVRPFQMLVGPNASGKSTFFDVVSFLSDLTSSGLSRAVNNRTGNFCDLTWNRQEAHLQLAVEVAIGPKFDESRYDLIRYEVAVTAPSDGDTVQIDDERVFLLDTSSNLFEQERGAFLPVGTEPSLISPTGATSSRRLVLAKTVQHADSNDLFIPESSELTSHESYPFKLGTHVSALSALPEDKTKFPVTAWFRDILRGGIAVYRLDSAMLRRASPPKLGNRLRADAANLPWVIEDLKAEHPERFDEWLRHVQTALPDLVDIRTVLREDDRHRYLVLKYAGVEVPSWCVSDGTLRLLALTIPAYIERFEGILLIEEPENGLHPLAIETVMQSLRSVYDGQVLVATHSPLIVTQAGPEEVLCFNHDAENGTHIVSGDKHPHLSDWQGEVSLGTLFASGVLG